MKRKCFVLSTCLLVTVMAQAQNVEPKYIELTAQERQMVNHNNQFAFRLFKEARNNESLILSPLSITYALGLINNGATGETRKQINETLGFGDYGAEAINKFCKKMLTESPLLDESTRIMIANTIYVNAGLGYSLQPTFTELSNNYYDAQPQARNFYDLSVVDEINQWGNDHTLGMIPQVLSRETFNPDAISYLLNAIYFKGEWTLPFDADETREEPFDAGPTVPMMHMNETLSYSDNETFQMAKLPYGNTIYNISILLPREHKTIDDVLEYINEKSWPNVYYSTRDYILDLKLPSFETESRVPLNNIMSNIGMPRAFQPGYAEFPNFCNEEKDVFISSMFQVARIKLDEKGTEAAAVTVIGMETTSIDDITPKNAILHANRPFLYVISESTTGTIFFIGQYMGKGITSDIDGEAFGVEGETTSIYDLTGRRLKQKPSRGIYIQDGKKMLVK